MKQFFFLFLMITCTAFSQGIAPSPKFNWQNSTNDVKGNNNIVKVIQAGIVNEYNLSSDEGIEKFVSYIQTLPGIKKDVDKILRNTNEIKELLYQLANRSKKESVLETDAFGRILKDYINETKSLREENEKLRREATDANFEKTLREAERKLDAFDNEGYQQVLEDYKVNVKKEFAKASYLQAKNSQTNYRYEKALKQVTEALVLDNNNTDYLFLKAELLYSIGNYDECRKHYSRIINLTNELSLLAHCNNNIGLAWNAEGNLDKAIEYLEKALNISLKIFGEQSTDVATQYSNLGLAWQDKGDLDKAIEYIEKALVVDLRLLGEQSPSVAIIYNNLGMLWEDKGNLDKAFDFIEKALDINLKLFGEQSPIVASCYGNLGTIWQAKGNFEKAIDYLERAFNIDLKLFGEQNPILATRNNNLGLAWNAKGNLDKALEYFEKALAIGLRSFAEESPSIATYYNNLGPIWLYKGNPDKAIYFLEKALAIDLRLFGEQGSSAATCYNNLGLAWQTKGNLNEAVENFEKSLSIHLRLFGEENPKTKQIYQNAGWGIIEKGDKQKGLAYLRKTCFVGFSLYEEAQFFNLKGASKFMANQYGSAVNDYQTALYLLEQSKTEKTHTLWATLYQNMAKAYCQSGSKKKALHLFRKALLFAKSVKKGEIEIEKIEKNYADCKNK